MYLLDVLSSDKTNEMTLLKSLRTEYLDLPSALPSELASVLLRTALAHLTRRFESPTYESLITNLTAERNNGSRSGSLPPVAGPGAGIMAQVGTGAMHGPSPVLLPGAVTAPPPMGLDDGTRDMAYRGKGFLLPPPNSPPKRHAFLGMMEEVLGKYWHASGCAPTTTDPVSEMTGDKQPRPKWHTGDMPAPVDWVYLATPFMCCLARPVAVFFTFEKLMEKLGTSEPPNLRYLRLTCRIFPSLAFSARLDARTLSLSSAGTALVLRGRAGPNGDSGHVVDDDFAVARNVARRCAPPMG